MPINAEQFVTEYGLRLQMIRPWRGYELQTIIPPHFGIDPVEVFAIRVN